MTRVAFHFALACRAAMCSLLALGAASVPEIAAAATIEPTQAVNDFFPRQPQYSLFLYPHVNRMGPGRVGDEARGTVALHLEAADLYQRKHSFDAGLIVYTLDGVPISPRLGAPYGYLWDSTSVADGTHVLGVLVIDGPADLANYRVSPTEVVVDNVPGVVSGPQRLPVLGNSFSLHPTVSATPDWIDFPGTSVRPHASPQPLTYRYAPSLAGAADPLAASASANWVLESLNEGNTGLYQGKPAVYRNPGGHLVTNTLTHQDGTEMEYSAIRVAVRNNYDGPRNDNSISPYSTYVPNPEGTGWVGVDLGGRIFRVAGDGAVTTLAGVVSDSTQFPFDYQNQGVTAAQFASATRTVGNFAGGVHFNAPTDLAFDPRNSKILYVADYLNHRVAKVDLSVSPPQVSTLAGVPGGEGLVDGPAASARFDEPSSIAVARDGTIYVADQENFAIRRISADGTTVSTLASAATDGTFAPFAIRLDSKGDIIVAELKTGMIKKVAVATGRITSIKRLDRCLDPWIWLDVDSRGNVGPKDDILVVCVAGGSPVSYRLSASGLRTASWPQGSGGLEQGGLAGAVEVPGHYAWVVAIDDDEAKVVYQGLGNSGLRQLRLAQPGDPSFARYLLDMYAPINRGKAIMDSGTVHNFPFGMRPSFTALLGVTGHGHLGVVKNFDDLAFMSDSELAAYIRGGLGGSVPRPEFTGRDLDAMIYYIRMNSARALAETIPLPPVRADKTPPTVSDVAVTPLSDGMLEVTWKTNEPAMGFVAFGTSSRYHRWTSIESAFSTEHRAVLTELPEDKAVNLAIMVRDETGNQTFTANRVHTGGRDYSPTMLFEASAVDIAYNGVVTLRWASTGATACQATGGWSGNKPDSGTQATVPLKNNTTFDLECTGPGGSVSKTVKVTVAPLPTLTLTATPSAVAPGSGATLTWASSNTTKCTASGSWSGSKSLSGSELTLPITGLNVFVLNCTGRGGTVTRSAIASVGRPTTGTRSTTRLTTP